MSANEMIRIEDVRELKPIDGSSWHKPPTRSTLMRMAKSELVEWVAIGFANWHKSDEQIANMREFWKRKDEEIKLN